MATVFALEFSSSNHSFLVGNRLRGTIPEELGALKMLTSLELRNNLLSGTFPSKFFLDVHGLEALDVSENNLSSSSILDEIGYSVMAITLKSIKLGGNQFSGTIPLRMDNVKNLVEFNISHNTFEGNILDGLDRIQGLSGLSYLKNLDVLDVSYCDFTGGMYRGLISRLFNSSALTTFRIDGNSFTGPLPNELGSLHALSFLSLSRNKFAGTVPDTLGQMTGLKELDMSGNRLAGSLPTTFGNLTALKVLDVSNNRIIGNIPTELGSCASLEELLLDNNNLGGTVPSTLSELPSLGKFKFCLSSLKQRATIPMLCV